jgi:hypothetical protein
LGLVFAKVNGSAGGRLYRLTKLCAFYEVLNFQFFEISFPAILNRRYREFATRGKTKFIVVLRQARVANSSIVKYRGMVTKGYFSSTLSSQIG